MNLLLDTHVALWALADSPRLSDRAQKWGQITIFGPPTRGHATLKSARST